MPGDVEKLKSVSGTPLEYIIDNHHPTTECRFGKVQIGSILSYQV